LCLTTKPLLLTSCHVLPSFWMTAFLTYNSHLDLGLPLGLLPFIFKFETFFVILSSFIPQMCPYYLVLLFHLRNLVTFKL
jgi:hypothetical protein